MSLLGNRMDKSCPQAGKYIPHCMFGILWIRDRGNRCLLDTYHKNDHQDLNMVEIHQQDKPYILGHIYKMQDFH